MRIRLLVALAIAVTSVGVLPLTVIADPPSGVVFQLHPCSFAPPPEVGIWSASGSIDDSGTYVTGEGDASPPDRPFTQPGPFREAFILNGANGNGTLTIKAEERTAGTFPNFVQSGVWQVESGTGVYANASGHGDVAFSITPTPSCFGGITFTLTLAGVIGKVG